MNEYNGENNDQINKMTNENKFIVLSSSHSDRVILSCRLLRSNLLIVAIQRLQGTKVTHVCLCTKVQKMESNNMHFMSTALLYLKVKRDA